MKAPPMSSHIKSGVPITVINVPIAEVETPSTVIVDSEATISVAPKSFYNRVPLDRTCENEYNLQDPAGNPIKVYGTRKIPFRIERATIRMEVVVCDVAYPVFATKELIQKGVSLTFCSKQSFISFKARKYDLESEGSHIKLNLRKAIFKFKSDLKQDTEVSPNLRTRILSIKKINEPFHIFPVKSTPYSLNMTSTKQEYLPILM